MAMCAARSRPTAYGVQLPKARRREFATSMVTIVVVGSTNACKVSAVASTLTGYSRFAAVQVCGFKASSDVSEQPRSMQETLRGARNRAASAFASRPDVDVAFGIESGVFEMDELMFDICACVAVIKGGREAVGWSSAFEIPPRVAAHVRCGLDLSQASNAVGLSADPKLGEGQGLIGVLTEGRVDRLAYTRQAVTVCMIGVDREEVFE
jgi:inosine/xanthosine triphosphatase